MEKFSVIFIASVCKYGSETCLRFKRSPGVSKPLRSRAYRSYFCRIISTHIKQALNLNLLSWDVWRLWFRIFSERFIRISLAKCEERLAQIRNAFKVDEPETPSLMHIYCYKLLLSTLCPQTHGLAKNTSANCCVVRHNGSSTLAEYFTLGKNIQTVLPYSVRFHYRRNGARDHVEKSKLRVAWQKVTGSRKFSIYDQLGGSQKCLHYRCFMSNYNTLISSNFPKGNEKYAPAD